MADNRQLSPVFEKLVVPVIVAVASVAATILATILFTPDWEESARNKGWVSLPEWQTKAKSANWIPKEECPAYPISIKLTSPGSGATIPFEDSYKTGGGSTLRTDLVVNASRPVPKGSAIGIIVGVHNVTNLYVIFPRYDDYDEQRRLLNWSDIEIPEKLQNAKELKLRAFMTNNKKLYGKAYSDLEQILSQDKEIVVSEEVLVHLITLR